MTLADAGCGMTEYSILDFCCRGGRCTEARPRTSAVAVVPGQPFKLVKLAFSAECHKRGEMFSQSWRSPSYPTTRRLRCSPSSASEVTIRLNSRGRPGLRSVYLNGSVSLTPLPGLTYSVHIEPLQ